jgi:copper transport protein
MPFLATPLLTRQCRSRVVLPAFAGLIALVQATAAFAHATLLSSNPTDGAMLPDAPRTLTLTFNEMVQPLVLRVVNPSGEAETISRYDRFGNSLVLVPPQGLGEGTHVLSWRVISADGHPVGGSVVFSVGRPSTSVPVAANETDIDVRAAIWVGRVLIYVGLFIGVGGAFFLHWLRSEGAPTASTRVLLAVLLVALPVLPLSVGLQGLDSLAAPLPALLQSRVWVVGAQSAFGVTTLLALAAIASALASLGVFASWARSLSLLALICAGLALAASGHASTARPRLLTTPTVFLHAIGVAFWIGALIPLLTTLHGGAPAVTATLLRFSRAIPFVLVAVVLCGAALAIIQLDARIATLWSTSYGRLLSLKLLLLAPLFGLAAYNRYKLTPSIAQGDAQAQRSMRRTISVELFLACMILAVVALWRFTPPARALVEGESFFTHLHTEKAMANVTIAPARAGPVDITIELETTDERPLDAMEVSVSLSNPQAGIQPITRPAVRTEEAQWRVRGVTVPVPGRWTLVLDILISDFDKVRINAPVQIGR